MGVLEFTRSKIFARLNVIGNEFMILSRFQVIPLINDSIN